MTTLPLDLAPARTSRPAVDVRRRTLPQSTLGEIAAARAKLLVLRSGLDIGDELDRLAGHRRHRLVIVIVAQHRQPFMFCGRGDQQVYRAR
jgi:hypothetical protein